MDRFGQVIVRCSEQVLGHQTGVLDGHLDVVVGAKALDLFLREVNDRGSLGIDILESDVLSPGVLVVEQGLQVLGLRSFQTSWTLDDLQLRLTDRDDGGTVHHSSGWAFQTQVDPGIRQGHRLRPRGFQPRCSPVVRGQGTRQLRNASGSPRKGPGGRDVIGWGDYLTRDRQSL